MEIEYITKYETKKYEISEIKKIEETDLTVLNPTEDNRITLITCVENQRNLRLCVTGVEKGDNYVTRTATPYTFLFLSLSE